MSSKNFEVCDRVSLIALSLSVFLGIIAFIPGGFMPETMLKGYLIVVCVIVAFMAWLVGRLIEGSFHIPKTPILAATGILTGVLLLSAVFAHGPYLSFFGEGFDQGTFALLASMLFGLFLATMLFTTRERIYTFLKYFFGIYVVLAVFQFIHVFFPSLTSIATFYDRVDTPVGTWSDWAFLSGAALVGFSVILQFLKPTKVIRTVSIVGASLALFFVIVTNILMVWILVGFSAIIILVYTLVINRASEDRTFPYVAFSLSLVALLFVLANTLIGGVAANLLKASYVDVHPSFSATLHVSGSSLRAHPILGAGPNHFLTEWLTRRPFAVNNSTLWDTPFTAGSSFLVTTAVLSGALGILAVLLFLFVYAYETSRKVFRNSAHPDDGLFVFGVFLMSLYFVLGVLLYAPGVSVTICMFVFVGLLFGTFVSERRIEMHTINFLKDQRAGFFSILAIVALLMVSAGTAYSATQHFGGLVFFEKSLVNAQNNDLDAANNRLSQAIALTDVPLFERTRVLLAEKSIQNTLSASSTSISQDQIKTTLQNAVSLGNSAGRQAVALDGNDPANYLALGDFLRMITPLKVDGVYDAGVQAYTNAISLAPQYPKPYLNLAELYFDNTDPTDAETYIQKALDEKSNYTDALFLRAQIQVAANDNDAALQTLVSATQLDPNNPDTYFELGLLRYNTADYADAIASFRVVLNLNSQYLNAWYYLALADLKIGSTQEANAILTALHQKYPTNQNITDALNGDPTPSASLSDSTNPPVTVAPATASTTPATTKTKKTTTK